MNEFTTVSELIEYLVLHFEYKKLPKALSERSRSIYLKYLPENFNINGDSKKLLYDSNGILIAKGYDRIVIGDYGAYVEINEYQIQRKNIRIKDGESYRMFDPQYRKNIKYHWYTSTSDSDIKIYYQIRKVSYADYIPGRYYIDPYQLS